MFALVIKKYNTIIFYNWLVNTLTLQRLNKAFSFLPRYYHLNNLLWQDGLLIDFLQKKILDKIIRQFLINSSHLFNERVIFTFVVRFYIDFVLIPQNIYLYFEFTNIASTLTWVWLTISFITILVNLNWLFLVMYPL